jgi:hypothetical protein
MPPETEGRKQHRMLQKECGSLYRIVSDILFRHDPATEIRKDYKRRRGQHPVNSLPELAH